MSVSITITYYNYNYPNPNPLNKHIMVQNKHKTYWNSSHQSLDVMKNNDFGPSFMAVI